MVTAGDELVRINLVAGVPDETVGAEVKDAVQSEAELDDAEVRCEVGRPFFQQVAQHIADFRGQLGELGIRHAVQVGSRFEFGQMRVHIGGAGFQPVRIFGRQDACPTGLVLPF